MNSLAFFGLATCLTVALLLNWKLEFRRHQRRLGTMRYRIHVNGIRGKSTVTRIVAGLLRQANLATVAKTTGSAACVVDRMGVDHSIRRNGSPTILEQVRIIESLEPDIEALVIECMAIKPEYQRICENKIVQSTIGILTNVREDHQDILGSTLQEIASNLLSTCPVNGVLITAEQNPDVLGILTKVTRQKNSRLIVVDANSVSDDELRAFPYVAFKENVAIGFAVADLMGIDRFTALEGMAMAAPDPGVLTIARKQHKKHNIVWADLFAVNDRESVIACSQRVAGLASPTAIKIGLLNNRADREHRAIQFANIAACDLELDFIALLGAYERRVAAELKQLGVDEYRIIRAGENSGLQGSALVERLVESVAHPDVLILGMVNIHTDQAESLRHWFHAENAGACHELH